MMWSYGILRPLEERKRLKTRTPRQVDPETYKAALEAAREAEQELEAVHRETNTVTEEQLRSRMR